MLCAAQRYGRFLAVWQRLVGLCRVCTDQAVFRTFWRAGRGLACWDCRYAVRPVEAEELQSLASNTVLYWAFVVTLRVCPSRFGMSEARTASAAMLVCLSQRETDIVLGFQIQIHAGDGGRVAARGTENVVNFVGRPSILSVWAASESRRGLESLDAAARWAGRWRWRRRCGLGLPPHR
jgi:hypothetical protein